MLNEGIETAGPFYYPRRLLRSRTTRIDQFRLGGSAAPSTEVTCTKQSFSIRKKE